MEHHVDHHQRDSDTAEEFEDIRWNFVGADHAHRLADEFLRDLPELRHHSWLEIVGFDDAIAGERFVHELGEIRGVVLDRAGGFANLPGVMSNRYDAKGQHDNGKKGQYRLISN